MMWEGNMDKLEKRILKEPEFEYIDIIINETYIDDNGLERERQKKLNYQYQLLINQI